MSLLRGPHVACPPFFSFLYRSYAIFFLPYRGPTCCVPAIFSLISILSWLSLLLIIHLFLFNCWSYSFHVHPFHADFIPRFSCSHYSAPYRHISPHCRSFRSLVCCFLVSRPRFDHSLPIQPYTLSSFNSFFVSCSSIHRRSPACFNSPTQRDSFLHSFRCRDHPTPVPPFEKCSVIPSCRPGLGLIRAPPCLPSHSSRTACHLH